MDYIPHVRDELPKNPTAVQRSSEPAPSPSPQRSYGPLAAIGVAVLLFLAAQIAASLVLSVYPRAHGWTEGQTNDWLNGAYVQFFYVLLAEALTVGGLLWFLRRRKLTLGSLGWKRFRPIHIAYALAGFGVYFVAYIVLVNVASNAIPDLNVNQQQDIGFQQVYGAGQLLTTFLSLVVLPPLVEETLFRGFLFTSFRKRIKFVWTTLLVSVLFALPHLLEAQSGGLLWIGALDTFTLSIVLCYLRKRTGSLWSGVLVHALKNGIAFLSLYILHVH